MQGPDDGFRMQVCVPLTSQTMSLARYCAPHSYKLLQASPSFGALMHVPVVATFGAMQVSPSSQSGPTKPSHVAPALSSG